MFLRCDASVEAVACVGSAHTTGVLLAVERQSVHTDLRTPESAFKALSQGPRLIRLRACYVVMPENRGQLCASQPRGVYVALHLAECDWPFGQSTVRMEDRIVRVLPALLHQAIRRAPMVLNEAVSVRIAVAVDPLERSLHIGPDRLDEGDIRGAPVVSTGQHDKQRSGIDAAVIAGEGNLSKRGHLAAASLVQNLAGLSILVGVAVAGLGLGEEGQDTARDVGRQPQALESCDDAVASEWRVEPGDSRVGIQPYWSRGQQHVHIGRRAREPRVQLSVRRLDRAPESCAIGARLRGLR